MPNQIQIYKCEKCGNIVEILYGGDGDLICCGEPMKLYRENTVDASREKHIPVIEKTGTGIKVKVGSVPHPMEEKHYIEWVQVLVGDKAYRQFLKPGQAPEASFNLEAKGVTVREYCSLHGLWRA